MCFDLIVNYVLQVIRKKLVSIEFCEVIMKEIINNLFSRKICKYKMNSESEGYEGCDQADDELYIKFNNNVSQRLRELRKL